MSSKFVTMNIAKPAPVVEPATCMDREGRHDQGIRAGGFM